MALSEQEKQILTSSDFLSRDLSWVQFNWRVLAQAKKERRTILEKLKFLAITASNLDEFMMIRVGSLYKYLDYGRPRSDYSGLEVEPFKFELLHQINLLRTEQDRYFHSELLPTFKNSGFEILKIADLSPSQKQKVETYFSKTIYPMLTPMSYDNMRAFPMLMNKVLVFGVQTVDEMEDDGLRLSFVQLPQNLDRFFELVSENGNTLFIPIEEIVREKINELFKNVEIKSTGLFRITRNGDFDYDDYDDSEEDFVEEIQKKLNIRKRGRVVRLEIEPGFPASVTNLLISKFSIGTENVFDNCGMLDYSSLWQIVGNKALSTLLPEPIKPVFPIIENEDLKKEGILSYLKTHDILLHHPYNDIENVLELLEESANDPDVLAIKITIYRLAKKSRVTKALLKAAENGKHVSVLFEVKARFDEENNILEGRRLEKAGCFVIYGVEKVKTHTKLMMVVRKEGNGIRRYVHMSSGNYNEVTAKIYTDTSYLTSNRAYGNDVAEFFNVITGHSKPYRYNKLITTPGDLRMSLIRRIKKEASNARNGIPAIIIFKINSLEDTQVISELYKASQAGVKIKIIVRGMCCLRPGRVGLSENIVVKSIIGDFLEHSRIYYFHNDGDPKVYGGSADVMVRSFDRRIESLFLVEGFIRQQMINILDYSLRDTMNSFVLKEDGSFISQDKKVKNQFNIHLEFFSLTKNKVLASKIK